jgi:hypothetical protein
MLVQSVNVQFDNEHFDFGVRVAPNSADAKDKPELFNAGTEPVQTEFGNAWFSLGAQHPENDIKCTVDGNARGGIVGPESAGKRASANADQTTATGQQEVRAADDPTLGAPFYGGAAQPQHQGHNIEAHQAPYGMTGASTRHNQEHHIGGHQDPSYEAPHGNTGTTMSETHLDHHFRAQNDPSYETSYGSSASTPSTLHAGNREDMSRASHVADTAAAKVADFVTKHHHPHTSGNQGSAAAAPSKYNQDQEYPVGAHDTRTAP